MIKVNNNDYPHREGMTIQTMMKEKGFVFHRIIVKLNGKVLDEASYADTVLQDGDIVEAIHVFAGG